MRMTWVVGFALLWLIGSLISLTLEGTYIGQETQFDSGGNPVGTVSTLDKLMRPEFSEMTNPISFVVGVFNIVWSYLGAIWNMLWWNYAMFTGVWSFFKYIGWALDLSIVVSLVLAIRGTPSG